MSVDNKYIPKTALVFYQSSEGNENIIEEHKIINGVLGPAKPVNIEIFETFAYQQIKNKDNAPFGGRITSNILYLSASASNFKLVWYTEQKQWNMLFDSDMGIESGMYPLPYLLWVMTKNDTSVYALKSIKNIENQPLYYGPIPNNDDSFCFGNAKIKKSKNIQELIPDVEKTVLEDSIFTHFGNNVINVKNKELSTITFGKLLNNRIFDNKLLKRYKTWKVKDIF